jgi:enamine deaminase RidA (YjgF/YER057c/UK114 family)
MLATTRAMWLPLPHRIMDNERSDQAVELISPPSLSPPVGFAHASAGGGFVWLGGQIGSDATGKVLAPGNIAEQFRQAIRNVGVALEAAGCPPARVVKLTYYVTDVAAYRAALKPIGEAYREVFGRHYPAATLVQVVELFDPEAMVEIDCIAVRPIV